MSDLLFMPHHRSSLLLLPLLNFPTLCKSLSARRDRVELAVPPSLNEGKRRRDDLSSSLWGGQTSGRWSRSAVLPLARRLRF